MAATDVLPVRADELLLLLVRLVLVAEDVEGPALLENNCKDDDDVEEKEHSGRHTTGY